MISKLLRPWILIKYALNVSCFHLSTFKYSKHSLTEEIATTATSKDLICFWTLIKSPKDRFYPGYDIGLFHAWIILTWYWHFSRWRLACDAPLDHGPWYFRYSLYPAFHRPHARIMLLPNTGLPRVNVRLLITFQIFAVSASFTSVIIITDRTDCTDLHHHVT